MGFVQVVAKSSSLTLLSEHFGFAHRLCSVDSRHEAKRQSTNEAGAGMGCAMILQQHANPSPIQSTVDV